MNYPTRSMAALLTVTMLCACTEPNGAPGKGIENGGALSKKNVAVAAGVVTGGLAGSAIGSGAGRVAAIIGGGLLGGALGNLLGDKMDNEDRAAYDTASQRAMNTGKVQKWSNGKTGHRGTIMPHARYRDDAGNECREYSQTIYVDGRKEKGYGTACRAPDGSWIVDE